MKITLKQHILPIGMLFVLAMDFLAGCGERRNLPVTSAAPTDKNPISELSPTPTSTVNKTYPRDILFFQLGSTLAYFDDTEVTQLNVYTLTGDAYISSDGTKIITRQQEGLIFHNLRTNEITRVPQPQVWGGYWWDGDWHPEERFLAYNLPEVQRTDPKDPSANTYDDYPAIYIADLENNSYVRLTTGNISEKQPRWSPDGHWLAYISDNNIYLKPTTCLSDLHSCSNIQAINMTHMKIDGYINGLAWNPTGTKLGYVQYNYVTEKSDLYTVDLDGKTTNITNTPDASEYIFDWSPDGKQIAYQYRGPGLDEDLCIMSIADHSIECLSNISTPPGNILWSPDGTKVAVINHIDNQVWELLIYFPIDKTTHRYQVADLGFLISWAIITGPINN
jgi:hypothetical protein